MKWPIREADRLSQSFAKVNDVGNIPLWYTAQLSFTFTVDLIIEFDISVTMHHIYK